MNLFIIIICIVGIAQTNYIFTDLTNAECSILRFINEVLEGETKSTLPKWGGIDGIISIFEKTVTEIEILAGNNAESEIKQKTNDYLNAISTFHTTLKDACDDINNEATYLYNDYILDLAKKFGKYDDENKEFTEDSYAKKWETAAYYSNDNVEDSFNALKALVHGNVELVMEMAEGLILNIEFSIEGIKDMIGEVILK